MVSPSLMVSSVLFSVLLLLTSANLVHARMAGLMRACKDQNATCLQQCESRAERAAAGRRADALLARLHFR